MGPEIFTLDAKCNAGTDKEETILYSRFVGSKYEACKFLADFVMQEMGDGDSENGGKGSLKNCYGDIFNALMAHGNYQYADCVFTIARMWHGL